MASTLLLDPDTWDLVVDANSNIAVAAEPYALAQDAASYIKLFQGELWYDTTRGIPYFSQILGRLPPVGVMKTAYVSAAELVPDVITAQCFISSTANRIVQGQVQILDDTGAVIAASSF
jgi:hypothetical protein